MTSAETVTEIKDIVVIIFLSFVSVVVVVFTVLGIRLYGRAGRFMDRMEIVADRLESTFYGVAVAGRALRPMASGLGLLGVAQGVGRIFGLARRRKKRK